VHDTKLCAFLKKYWFNFSDLERYRLRQGALRVLCVSSEVLGAGGESYSSISIL